MVQYMDMICSRRYHICRSTESVGIRELAVGKRRRTEAIRADGAEETKVEDMISRFPNLMWYKSTRSSYDEPASRHVNGDTDMN